MIKFIFIKSKGGESSDYLEQIYDKDFIDNLLDNDEISAEEAGFMNGYNTQ